MAVTLLRGPDGDMYKEGGHASRNEMSPEYELSTPIPRYGKALSLCPRVPNIFALCPDHFDSPKLQVP